MTPPPSAETYHGLAAGLPARRSRLQGEVRCDVCVVGGGYTGLGAAIELAGRGLDVVVLEARHAGWGASGRNGGQLHSGFSPGAMGTVAAVGPALAARLWRLAEEAKAHMAGLIATHDIRCHPRSGVLIAADKDRHMCALRQEQALMEGEYGYRHLRLLGRAEMRDLVASERFRGGLLDMGGGHLEPLALCLGLAGAAEAAGARIFEDSPVLRVMPGRPVRAVCAEGAVAADHLILAGNAYLEGLVPEICGRVMPAGTYVMATEPLGDLAERVLRRDICVSDSNFVLDYFRLTAERRLLFGGGVSYSGRDPTAAGALLRQHMLRTFPQLAGIRIEKVWGGRVAITRNRLPELGRIGANLWFAHGYSGQGVALAAYCGRVLAEAIAGDPGRFETFAAIRHRRFPGAPAMRAPLLALAMSWYRLRDLV